MSGIAELLVATVENNLMPDSIFKFTGIRAIAIFEGARAFLILAVGFGLFSLIGRDVESFAVYVVKHVHLNPASTYPRIFIDAARHVSNGELWLFAMLTMVDAIIRGIDAVGLWYDRNWAKWLGVATASIYFPIEVYELARRVTWLKSAAFLTNIVIVVYLGYVLCRSQKKISAD